MAVVRRGRRGRQGLIEYRMSDRLTVLVVLGCVRGSQPSVPALPERKRKYTRARMRGSHRRWRRRLDGVLAKSPSGWLVGGKCTAADISFIPWNRAAIRNILKDVCDVEKELPHLWA